MMTDLFVLEASKRISLKYNTRFLVTVSPEVIVLRESAEEVMCHLTQTL